MATRKDNPPMDLRPSTRRSITRGPLAVARIIIGLFSWDEGKRRREEPPLLANKIVHLRLVTIAASHYCEKARWALDMLEEDPDSPYFYTEDGHPPGFHAFATVPITNDKGSSTPLLVFPDGHYLIQSDTILQELCPFLYPEPIRNEIVALEKEFGETFGVASRLCGYHGLLHPSKEFYPVLAEHLGLNTSTVEKFLFAKMLDKGIDRAFLKLMKITEENNERCRATLITEFDKLSKRLELNGGEYIMDTPNKKYGFTAADLAFSALVFPIVMPPELFQFFVSEGKLPRHYLELARMLTATTAGQHALRMYAKHRPLTAPGGKEVAIKSVGRDRLPWKEFAIIALGAVTATVVLLTRKPSKN